MTERWGCSAACSSVSLPAADELLDERVILGQARQLAVAKQVGAAVADVRDGQVGVVNVGGGDRRTHALVLFVRTGDVVDLPVGLADSLGQTLLGAA